MKISSWANMRTGCAFVIGGRTCKFWIESESGVDWKKIFCMNALDAADDEPSINHAISVWLHFDENYVFQFSTEIQRPPGMTFDRRSTAERALKLNPLISVIFYIFFGGTIFDADFHAFVSRWANLDKNDPSPFGNNNKTKWWKFRHFSRRFPPVLLPASMFAKVLIWSNIKIHRICTKLNLWKSLKCKQPPKQSSHSKHQSNA